MSSQKQRHHSGKENSPLKRDMHTKYEEGTGGGHYNHSMMVADFKRCFWVSLAITVPILLVSPLIQELFNIQDITEFPGASYVLWGLSSAVFVYGGFPFLKEIFTELKSKSPGMMTFIALAITVAYAYSSAVVFGLSYQKTWGRDDCQALG